MKKFITISSFATFVILACQPAESNHSNTEILATAFGENLYLSDLSSKLENSTNSSDSQFVISRHVDNWLMDKILYQEAQKEIKISKKLNQKVEDYKKSLYIYELENLILDQSLNTNISQAELDTFYNKNLVDFKLDESVARILYIKVPTELDNDTLKDYWKTEDLPALSTLLEKTSALSMLELNEWYPHSKLKNLMPEKLFKKINFSKTDNYSLSTDKSKYYVKVLENIKSKEQAPVNFVEQNIRDRILHNRTQKILKEKRQAFYQDNIANKNITIQQ